MENIFEQFKNEVDWEALKHAEDSNTGRSYKEVPPGNYQVNVDKMEWKESKSGLPMLSIWFKIAGGKYDGCRVFYNQTIKETWMFENMVRFLHSLALDSIDGQIEQCGNNKQFENMLKDAEEEIDAAHISYELKYGKTKSGYPTFEIIDSFAD